MTHTLVKRPDPDPKSKPKIQENIIFIKHTKNRDLGARIGPSGSKLRCASFWFNIGPGKQHNCFKIRNAMPGAFSMIDIRGLTQIQLNDIRDLTKIQLNDIRGLTQNQLNMAPHVN